jgi:peroxiredoxin
MSTRPTAEGDGRCWPRAVLWLLVFGLTVPGVMGLHKALSKGAGRTVEGPLEFTLHDPPPEVPVVAFNDARGKPMTLDAFRGRTVLLHLWTTSLPASGEQLGSLDRLQQRFARERLEVVALSLDTGDDARAVVQAWFAQAGLRHLKIYHDPTAGAAKSIGATELPTTVLLDADGREKGRTNAVLLWDSEAASTFLQKQLTSAGVVR